VFWALIVDVFNAEQGKRLFGFIAAGASLGGIAGSSLTATLAPHVSHVYLLLASAALLELAVFSVRRLSRVSDALHRRFELGGSDKVIGGGVLTGLTHVFKSRYLMSGCVYMLLFAITSTFLYFQQAEIARASFADRGSRTAFFAQIDLLVNVLTLGVQFFLTGRILKGLGVSLTMLLLPVVSVLGFGMLALVPTITVLVAYQVIRRATNFAIARPTRELLFTVISREDKYKAKSFMDTFVYRTGDQLGAWSYALLGSLGLGLIGVSIVAAAGSVAWLANAFWLGRKQEELAKAGEGSRVKGEG
jgi:AAA family ATP:ADP antiporter